MASSLWSWEVGLLILCASCTMSIAPVWKPPSEWRKTQQWPLSADATACLSANLHQKVPRQLQPSADNQDTELRQKSRGQTFQFTGAILHKCIRNGKRKKKKKNRGNWVTSGLGINDEDSGCSSLRRRHLASGSSVIWAAHLHTSIVWLTYPSKITLPDAQRDAPNSTSAAAGVSESNRVHKRPRVLWNLGHLV